ncbi:hypothetical protein AVEN_134723-1 [Araneus ventricosus]|uniref:Uncharacterized protein n=1 Tax=Araneus ventricosus TaxID=182803 RepID=A0A4Y2S846_ARAVE|nr:hypothetical protein AVEN_68232-1 [Araneus ventricosus]GBN84211.1 hypothetical protein AVEN_152721-1 [Araneus ventricosus]GBN88147.1 hypothetical protein AVEN_172911-1 [Araneus ventricosus]GBN88159.1 hypothetical protein AVEN_134723-1 [Araneus ventricosus]
MLSTGNTKRTALAQISKTNRQQITTNNCHSTFRTARCLSAYQLALRTNLQSQSSHYQTRSTTFRAFIDFSKGCNDTWNHLEHSVYQWPCGKVSAFGLKRGSKPDYTEDPSCIGSVSP